MAIEHMLWALAETIRSGMVDPDATPAFVWSLEGVTPLPKSGYAVAYPETQNQSGREGLHFAVTHAHDHARVIAGRVVDDRIYFDSVRIYRDRGAAVNAARQNGHIGIYNLSRQEYVPLTERGETLLRGSRTPFPPCTAIPRLNRSRRSPRPRWPTCGRPSTGWRG